GGTRAWIYLKSVLIMNLIHAAEFVLFSALWTPVMLGIHLARDPFFVLGAQLVVIALLVAVRTALVNVILPYGLIRHAASQLDRWVLYEKRPSEWPERRWSEAVEA
ncbi:MAG: hypothetical protein ACYTGB_14330, partial [Planctomycetota bacterium]